MVLATRNPMLLFVLSGVLLLRLEERTLFVLLFHEPPRSTRFVVSGSQAESHDTALDRCAHPSSSSTRSAKSWFDACSA